MTARFAFFVDGSNLYGALTRSLGLEINDYEQLYRYLFCKCVESWKRLSLVGPEPICQLTRVHWYVVGAIDEWDMRNQRTEASLRSLFELRDASDMRAAWISRAAAANPGMPEASLQQKAFALCLADFEGWYQRQQERLRRMKSFYSAVRAHSSLVDLVECGRWKVDFIGRRVVEKGIDTQLAVDMLDLVDAYDVAVVVSGDADSIPSIRYAKRKGKQVMVTAFKSDNGREERSSNFSSLLKSAADIVLDVRASDLLREPFARKRDSDSD